MATSGSQTFEFGFPSLIDLTFSWERTSYSIANNTSTISWSLTYKVGLNNLSDSTKIVVSVNGQKYTGTFNYTWLASGTALSGTTTITHNNDGTKSFPFAFAVGTYDINGNSSEKGSATYTLDTLLRPATISTATNFTDDENPVITYSNVSGNSVTTLQACIADSTGNTIYAAYRDISKTGSSYTFNLTSAERKALRSAASGATTLSVRFYVKSIVDGTTFYKFLTRTMTIGDSTPTVNPVVKDTNSVTLALTGNESILIPGYSNAYYSIGATPAKEATIQSQSATCGAIVKTTATGTFTAVPNYEFTFYCRDSRGNYIYQTYEADYIQYFKVTCNQTVHLNLDGTVRLVVTGKYFNGSFGKKNNTLKIEARSRETGGTWSSWGDISVLLADASGGTYTLTATMSGFDPSGTYEFQARATDALTTATSGEDSVTLKPIFDWSKYDFNFNVPLTIEGYSLNDFVVETGTEPMGTNGTWYWRKWKSGRAECYGCRNYGNMAVTTAWGGLYRSGAFTQPFPSGLFADTPEVIDISFRGGSTSGGWIANHENSAPSSSETGSFILVRPASATLTGSYLSFNVIGRWK